MVADRLTTAISEIANKDFHPRDFELVQSWWHSNKTNFPEWPFPKLKEGVTNLDIGRFTEAANALEDVLRTDPTAEMSRALAMTSLYEMGETNRAAEIRKGFSKPPGRWSQWAAAKVELETGSVSNATAMFAQLATSNPTMPYLPHENFLMWRKLDWQLFRNLTSTESQKQQH